MKHETKIPGIKAKHAIITPTCRWNRSNMGAFFEAVERLKQSYIELQIEANKKANFHIVLTVERDLKE